MGLMTWDIRQARLPNAASWWGGPGRTPWSGADVLVGPSTYWIATYQDVFWRERRIGVSLRQRVNFGVPF